MGKIHGECIGYGRSKARRTQWDIVCDRRKDKSATESKTVNTPYLGGVGFQHFFHEGSHEHLHDRLLIHSEPPNPTETRAEHQLRAVPFPLN